MENNNTNSNNNNNTNNTTTKEKLLFVGVVVLIIWAVLSAYKVGVNRGSTTVELRWLEPETSTIVDHIDDPEPLVWGDPIDQAVSAFMERQRAEWVAASQKSVSRTVALLNALNFNKLSEIDWLVVEMEHGEDDPMFYKYYNLSTYQEEFPDKWKGRQDPERDFDLIVVPVWWD